MCLETKEQVPGTDICPTPGMKRFLEVLDNWRDPQNYEKMLKYQPQRSEVFIATFGKSGTTLVSQMCHQLRTGGHMDFKEITEVVPFLELAYDLGMDPNGEQIAEPRLTKTHLEHDLCPKGARYIVVLRNPIKALVSYYNFVAGWFFRPEEISVDEYVQTVHLKEPRSANPRGFCTVHTFFESWWRHRNDPDYLFLFYEHILADPETTARKVNNFMGLDDDEERIQNAVRMSSREYMLKHEDHFDEHLTRLAKAHLGSLPNGNSTKVLPADFPKPKLSAETLAEADRLWKLIVQPTTGYATYEEMLNDNPMMPVLN
uniref:Sulfotransferase domain-containing protein n=1 Tax=Rhodosorus marinus TaxID=101924 RepID=A0A7S2ZUY4_9RHOD|mmetsp:Transcript_33603/g.132524  ORF Transcript_33603/g.132524 Transcript_33603/m.132524 type:complete len:316 (+) Transcript_33603:352-1299(+)